MSHPMQHAIDVLQRTDDQLTSWLNVKARKGAPVPDGWRPSEWAMHVSSIKIKHRQMVEAIQILRGVGKD